MKPSHLLLSAALALPALLTASSAQAQDDDGYEDLDNAGSSAKKGKKKKKSRQTTTGPVREIVKGTYAKANVGGALYLLDFRGFVNAGTSVGLSVGHDFVDQEKISMAAEVFFFQGIHNGCYYELQATGECPNRPGEVGPLIQGDLRTYTMGALYEISGYPMRRFGIGARIGGGVLLSPLLMDEGYFNDEVVLGAWGGQNPGYHGAPHPVVMGGPTVEYYTKLGHFSVGADIDAFYAIGFDLGMSTTGYMKYTF